MKATLSLSRPLSDPTGQRICLRITPRSQPYAASLSRHHHQTGETHSADTITHQLNAVYSDNTDSSLEQPFMAAQLGTLSHETW